ncbi:MAG: SulP family inorganic anion transporter [Actinomycetota bacterium]
MSEARRSLGLPATIAAGVIVGLVEAVLAIAFAALVFGGLLVGHLADGIGLYLVGAALTMGILAWRAGGRGVVGGAQGAAAAVHAVVATSTALGAFGGLDRAFLTVVGVTLVLTLLIGGVFLLLGVLKRGNLIRYVPYPVVGGFVAGTGWLLIKGGVAVSSGTVVALEQLGDLIAAEQLRRWLPALAFGVLLLVLTRLIRKPLVIPIAIGAGLSAFAVGMLVTGSSLEVARDGRWLLGPLQETRLWEPWTVRAVAGADWVGVLKQAPGILAATFVVVLAMLFNVAGSETILSRDLDTDRELRDAGVANLISGALGGIPGFHALSLTSLVRQMAVDARPAGAIAALVPLCAAFFGGDVVTMIPRMLVGGMLVFVGSGLMVAWVIDRRGALPPSEYLVMLAVVAAIATKGLVFGVGLGVVLALVLLAVNYGRIEIVREVAFGETFRSNVDRASVERAFLRSAGERLQILRVNGFVFFGSASRLLERIRARAEATSLRFLVLDLRRVSGMDSSAVVAFRKAAGVARAGGFELVITGASERARAQLARGGVIEEPGVLGFEPDLDRGLERCEDDLLAEAAVGGKMTASGTRATPVPDGGDPLAGMPAGLREVAERVSLPAGTVLMRQSEAPDDVFVLASGRLRVELETPEGTRVRLRTLLPGVVVGEVALYTGMARTADVVAEVPSDVLRLSREAIAGLETSRPEVASALHRWLAATVSERLTETQRAIGALTG